MRRKRSHALKDQETRDGKKRRERDGKKPGNSKLTKYEMIEFTDFCEACFLPESVARVATKVGHHHCPMPRH
ncbi:hypothetical protein TNCV_2341161 [Trichonephila clavipes]|nr:hypothetical protein TNCV_2341161 [Trichonephila clavipes]